MLPRPTMQDDDDGSVAEELYGKPQHEIAEEASEQELYGDPQHDVSEDRFPMDFDPDVGYALIDYPDATVSRRPQESYATER